MSSSSQGGGAREQRTFGFAVTAGVLVAGRHRRGAGPRRGLRWSRGAPPPRQHGTPQRPKRLRCIGPLAASPPCNNISTRRRNALRGTLEPRALFTINFANWLMLYLQSTYLGVTSRHHLYALSSRA